MVIEVTKKSRHSGSIIKVRNGWEAEPELRNRQEKKRRVEPKRETEVAMNAGSQLVIQIRRASTGDWLVGQVRPNARDKAL